MKNNPIDKTLEERLKILEERMLESAEFTKIYTAYSEVCHFDEFSVIYKYDSRRCILQYKGISIAYIEKTEFDKLLVKKAKYLCDQFFNEPRLITKRY